MDDPGEEVLAVVDDCDNQVGTATLAEIHRYGLMHREAHTYLISGDKRLLLQLRADNGLWDISSAGHFGPHEDYLDGALREFEEELGIRLDPSDFTVIAKRSFDKEGCHISKDGKRHPIRNRFFATLFSVHKDIPNHAFILDPSEVKDARYFSAEEILRLLESDRMTDSCKEGIRAYVLSLVR